MRRAGVTALAVATLVGLGASACGRDYSASTDQESTQAPAAVVEGGSQDGYFGVLLGNPIPMPEAVLTASDGQPFDLRADTSGRYTLVYAGYTNCPDVCPTTVADLAAALRGMDPQLAGQVDVLMVSTDPPRDTPPRMRQWLDQFSTDFEGLTGPTDEVLSTINAMGIDVQPPQEEPDGSLTVEHGAQVLAFAPGGEATLLWTSGTTPSEFRDDLTQLLSAAS